MKTIFSGLVVLCALVSSIWAQGVTACTPNSAVTGQNLTVSILGSGSNFSSASTTYLYNGSTYIYPTQWSFASSTNITATYNISPTAQLGSYNVVVAHNYTELLINGFSIFGGLPGGSYGEVRGRLFKDTNANCVHNFGESVYANRIVQFLPGPYYASTDYNGDYSVWLPLGTYTASFVSTFPNAPSCPASGTQTVNVTTNGQLLYANFATNLIPFVDGYVTVFGQNLRPGFSSNIYITATNGGNQPITSATVRYIKPSFTNLVSSNPTPASISGDTLTWTLTNLVSQVGIGFVLSTPVTTPLGTPYDHDALITTTPADYIPVNDHFVVTRDVSGAFDPNDKQVFLPSGQSADGDISPTDSLLTYMVRFQNTGTDTAFNIYVRDTIDIAHLDLSSLRILAASHNYRLVSSGSQGQLEIAFPNILLPDSGINQAGSNGHFIYQIKRRNNLPPGTVIPNTASIYFDFNAPVVTNTTETRICDFLNAGFSPVISGATAQFTDQSAGTVQGWLWDFGDGATSTLQHPAHTYAADGNYQACLITTGVCRSDTACFPISICATAPTTQFSPAVTGLSATFSNTSLAAVAYSWDFGDGGTSTLPNPSHTYAANGTYTVCLITTSNCGINDTACSSLTVCVAPTAGMSYVSGGTGNLSFSDGSMHASAWAWDFGDGTTSTQQNPTHQYAADGNYTVCLIVQSGCDADTVCSSVSICGIPVVTNFTATSALLTATFTDASTNSQTYAWDFGDGSPIGTTANPSHVYATVGTYMVCLTTTSACGTSDTYCTSVAVCAPPTASWNFTQATPGALAFSDGSQYATAWHWDFGTGATSSVQNPVHNYTSNNIYTICLIASNACGADTTCTTLPICPGTVQAAFAASANQYTYQFTDQSGNAVSYAWDFGDGATSTLQHPTHTYAANGTYTVCLTVTDLCGTIHTQCTTLTVTVVGIAHVMPGFSVAVLPNPMHSQATVWVRDAGLGGEYSFQLYDISGALVRSHDGQLNMPLVLERGQLAAGMYIFRILHNGLSLGSGRIVVE
jgi:PKD repeat protein